MSKCPCCQMPMQKCPRCGSEKVGHAHWNGANINCSDCKHEWNPEERLEKDEHRPQILSEDIEHLLEENARLREAMETALPDR